MILLNIPLPTAAAGAAEEAYAVIPYDARIISAKLVPHTAAGANGTNYATVGLAANDGANGASFSPIATSLTTETVALVLGTVREFALTAPNVVAGTVVRVAKTFAGSGAVADCSIILELEKIF